MSQLVGRPGSACIATVTAPERVSLGRVSPNTGHRQHWPRRAADPCDVRRARI